MLAALGYRKSGLMLSRARKYPARGVCHRCGHRTEQYLLLGTWACLEPKQGRVQWIAV